MQSSSIAKHNPPLSLPALSSSLGLFRGPALRRSYRRRLCPSDDQAGHTSRLNHQDAAEPPHAISPDSLHVTPAGASTARPSHAPAPPYHPTVRTRRRIKIMTPGRPAAGTLRHRQIDQPNTGRRGAPTFALASLDLARCLRRPPEDAGPPMPQALLDIPTCRNLGSRHQSKFTLKKTFRAAHTPPPLLKITSKIDSDRRSMPHYPPRYTTESPLLCRRIDIPEKRCKNKPNIIDRTQNRRKTAGNNGIEAVFSNKNDLQRRKNLKNRPPERPRKDSGGYGPRSQSVATL